MNGTPLICAIIGHLVGDYLLQNDWMALWKKSPGSTGNTACVIHCIIWSFAVVLFAGWHRSPNAMWLCWALFLTHYIQDRTHIIKFWMTRINRQPRFVEPPLAPWSLIVVDNVWHIVTIWAVWKFIA